MFTENFPVNLSIFYLSNCQWHVVDRKCFNYSIKRPALLLCWLLRRVLTNWCINIFTIPMSSMGTDIIRCFRIYNRNLGVIGSTLWISRKVADIFDRLRQNMNVTSEYRYSRSELLAAPSRIGRNSICFAKHDKKRNNNDHFGRGRWKAIRVSTPLNYHTKKRGMGECRGIVI